MGPDGSIDWWCPGRFDARPALSRFSGPEGAFVRLAPAGPGPANPGDQSWEPETGILRTRLPAPGGRLDVVDLLPWAGPGFAPAGRVVRLVTAVGGPVELEATVQPSPRRGEVPRSWRVSRFSTGIAFDGLLVRTGFPLDDHAGTVQLGAGQRLVVTIDVAGYEGPALSPGDADELHRRTAEAWRRHLGALAYDGPYADEVARSLLVVKTHTSGANGALIAGPVTPHCELADGAEAVAVAYQVGMFEEAAALASWLVGALDVDEPPLPAAFTIDGSPVEEGDEERRLAGPALYAALASAVRPDRPGGEAALASLWDGLARMAHWLADTWRPAPGDDQVADGLAVWHTLDRLAALAVSRNPLSLDAVAWRSAANDVLAWLDDQRLTEPGHDPALLRAPWSGPWGPDDERARRVVQGVLDGWAADEGVHEPDDLALQFRAVEALARLGRWDEAHQRMEALVGRAGPLGLFPVGTGGLPSAGDHLALVRAAVALSAGPR